MSAMGITKLLLKARGVVERNRYNNWTTPLAASWHLLQDEVEFTRQTEELSREKTVWKSQPFYHFYPPQWSKLLQLQIALRQHCTNEHSVTTLFQILCKKVGCTSKKGRCSNFVVALQTPTLSFVKVCEEPLKNGSIFAPKNPCWKICFFNLAIDGVVVFSVGTQKSQSQVELKICKKL